MRPAVWFIGMGAAAWAGGLGIVLNLPLLAIAGLAFIVALLAEVGKLEGSPRLSEEERRFAKAKAMFGDPAEDERLARGRAMFLVGDIDLDTFERGVAGVLAGVPDPRPSAAPAHDYWESAAGKQTALARTLAGCDHVYVHGKDEPIYHGASVVRFRKPKDRRLADMLGRFNIYAALPGEGASYVVGGVPASSPAEALNSAGKSVLCRLQARPAPSPRAVPYKIGA